MPGKLYIAPDGVAEDEVTSDKYYAGATKGKIEISVREDVREVRDLDGIKICDIRFGARLEIKGRLAAVSPTALSLLLGAKRNGYGAYAISNESAVRRMTVCLVCPVYGENEDFTLFLRAAARENGKLTLDPTGEDGVAFCVVSESKHGKTSASLCFGERSAS